MRHDERASVPIVLGSATSDTEEGRAFFQDRLRLYTGWVFVLSSGFYVLNAAAGVFMGHTMLREPANLLHLAASLTLGAVWLAARVRPWPSSTLAAMDAGALVFGCFFFAAMGTGFALSDRDPLLDPVHATLIGQLACLSTILTRAVALPSTPRRTLWLGIAALVPQVAMTSHVYITTAVVPAALEAVMTPRMLAIGNILNTTAWCVLAVAISTVGSSVIFGLRTEAKKIRRLGQYTLENKVGEGGMGIVYRARHALLRRPTAVKLLPPDKMGEESISRFEREVQLTAELSHPSTVAIFDFGRTPAGVFYYAMEYLEGLNLDELVEEDGPQSPGRVIHILRQVSGALTEAHEHGLIHRDIKPANIILCERGGVPDVAKVVDFGLVRPILASDTDVTLRVTQDHLLTGTPMYMAPETIKGERFVDGRSDLYALGAVGYFLLAGEPMFRSRQMAEVIGDHLHTVPEPLSQRRPGVVPPDLEAVLTTCLQKSPADRFPTARALATALDRCADTTPWEGNAAATWWARHATASTASPTRPAADTGPLPTLAVDLDARMSSSG